MNARDPLALMLATGAQAEAVIRATVESLDADWDRRIAEINVHPGSTAAQDALVALEAIAPYRALLAACVTVWDTDDEGAPDVVKIGGGTSHA